MNLNIDILKSSAKYGKIYYIAYDGEIRQCKLIATAGKNRNAYYVLNIAGRGIRHIMPKTCSDNWWQTSLIESVMAASPEDLIKGKFLKDCYGSTCNAFNSRFIEPFFPDYLVCCSGGGIHCWKWNGLQPQLYTVTGSAEWRIDEKGSLAVLTKKLKDCSDQRKNAARQTLTK